MEIERSLINKIRVVEMYHCKRQAEVPEVEETK